MIFTFSFHRFFDYYARYHIFYCSQSPPPPATQASLAPSKSHLAFQVTESTYQDLFMLRDAGTFSPSSTTPPRPPSISHNTKITRARTHARHTPARHTLASDYFVGTFASQFSRLAFEMNAAHKGGVSLPPTALSACVMCACFGWTRVVVSLLPFTPRRLCLTSAWITLGE